MEYGKVTQALGWRANPFSVAIEPGLLVGFQSEASAIMDSLERGDKFSLLIGPSGSGKTTLLKHLMVSKAPSGFKMLYLPKPPKDPQDWLGIFKGFVQGEPSLYTIGESFSIEGKLCIFVDEAHEASRESLEWLRSIVDQVNICVVLAGTQELEALFTGSLASIASRVTAKVPVSSLSPAESRELVKKRIESCGGKDIQPFTSEAIGHIHSAASGVPREVLKLCGVYLEKAFNSGMSTVDIKFLPAEQAGNVQGLSKKQKAILAKLGEGELSPSALAELLEGYYKDGQTANRAVNNILKRLLEQGLVERRQVGKGFAYSLSGRVRAAVAIQPAKAA